VGGLGNAPPQPQELSDSGWAEVRVFPHHYVATSPEASGRSFYLMRQLLPVQLSS
jgi:hypothetical protein